MATQTERTDAEREREHEGKRARLTLDLDPALHMRIKMAAAQQRLSMREYIERILREAVPETRESGWTEARPITPEVLAMLRERLAQQPVQPDSTELIRRMREERSEYLASL
ncbi:MAG TPA: toxin-antitoxin system HicB family antitoxin [Ktedonobacterales bacterium]|nr:toxin-antitoxin system HicB family antitoxin [Ktedonobacterales bacterium]